MGKDKKKTSHSPVGTKIRSFIDVLDRPWDWFRFLANKKSTNGALHKEELHIDYSAFWLEEEEERQKKKLKKDGKKKKKSKIATTVNWKKPKKRKKSA